MYCGPATVETYEEMPGVSVTLPDGMSTIINKIQVYIYEIILNGTFLLQCHITEKKTHLPTF